MQELFDIDIDFDFIISAISLVCLIAPLLGCLDSTLKYRKKVEYENNKIDPIYHFKKGGKDD